MAERVEKEIKKGKRVRWAELDFLLWIFVSISLFFILLYHTINVYAIAAGFITMVALYTRKAGIFNFLLFVLVTAIYSFLWVFAIQIGLNAYVILVNLIIALVLAFSIGIFYEVKILRNAFELLMKSDVNE